MRYDYRNDYKNWSLDKIKNHLPFLKDKLLQTLSFCDSSANNLIKRISYLEGKINTNH